MTTYDVRFRIDVPDDAEWTDHGYEDGDFRYKRIDPGADEPFVVVPDDAEISVVMPNGFYLDPRSRTLYHKNDGLWYFWDAGSWRSSCAMDDDTSKFERINAVS